MRTHTDEQLPTRVVDAKHLEHLLGQAQEAVEHGEPHLAITHLAQSVFVAATKGTNLPELELLRRVKNIIATGGRIA